MSPKAGSAAKINVFDISGRVVIVTGAASGLGKAVALGVGRHGAKVAAVDANVEGASEVSAVIAGEGGDALARKCDVTEVSDIHGMTDAVVARWGRIDALVNAAGISMRAPAESMPMELWHKVIAINLTGLFCCCQAVGRVMLGQGKGSIVNISSIAGQVGNTRGNAAYSSSKGGVDALTRLLAVEWATKGVRVNSIAPCPFATPAAKPVLEDPKIYGTIMAGLPMGRIGQPEELVGPAIFLVSDAASMVTGHTLSVDGGTLVF